MNERVTSGPAQPSRQRRPEAASTLTAVLTSADLRGAVPGMNSSSTVLRVVRTRLHARERVDRRGVEALGPRPAEALDRACPWRRRTGSPTTAAPTCRATACRRWASCRSCPSRPRRPAPAGSCSTAGRGSRRRGRPCCRWSCPSCRPPGAPWPGDPVGDLPLAPERVHAADGVAGQDVGHDVGRLARDDALAGGLRARRAARRPSRSSSMTSRIVWRGIRTPPLAIVAVRADHLDRMRPERADALGHDAGCPGQERRARSPWIRSYSWSMPFMMPGLDRGDVERELERAPETHRAALERRRPGSGRTLGPGRREVGDDVHEHRRGRHRLVVDAGQVHERLDR